MCSVRPVSTVPASKTWHSNRSKFNAAMAWQKKPQGHAPHQGTQSGGISSGSIGMLPNLRTGVDGQFTGEQAVGNGGNNAGTTKIVCFSFSLYFSLHIYDYKSRVQNCTQQYDSRIRVKSHFNFTTTLHQIHQQKDSVFGHPNAW